MGYGVCVCARVCVYMYVVCVHVCGVCVRVCVYRYVWCVCVVCVCVHV